MEIVEAVLCSRVWADFEVVESVARVCSVDHGVGLQPAGAALLAEELPTLPVSLPIRPMGDIADGSFCGCVRGAVGGFDHCHQEGSSFPTSCSPSGAGAGVVPWSHSRISRLVSSSNGECREKSSERACFQVLSTIRSSVSASIARCGLVRAKRLTSMRL